jgi:hypothetical protein
MALFVPYFSPPPVRAGPFGLRYVDLFVTKRSPGAFILSRNGRLAEFIGASPDDLAAALRHIRSRTDYQFFWFAYARSAKSAHELAHVWAHRYRPADNHAAPNPEGRKWQCPIKGCAACALDGAAR